MICASGNAPDAGRFYRRYHPIRGPNMATAEEHLMDWMSDAHALEEQAEKSIRATEGRPENYQALKERMASHPSDTNRQAERHQHCLARRRPSTPAHQERHGRTNP